MLAGFLALMTAIPGIGSIITGVTTAMYDAKVRLFMARSGATRDVAIETIRGAVLSQQAHVAELQTIAGSKVLVWLIVAFAAPIVIYEFQVVVIDNVIMRGATTTPAIGGDVAQWMNTIINWLFGASTALAGGSMALKAVEKLK